MGDNVAGRSELMWENVEAMILAGDVVVDRPTGSAHPRVPSIRYPVDYGYVAGTQGGDGEGIDVWRGTGQERLRALVATYDAFKRNAEVKYLFAVNDAEFERIVAFYRENQQDWLLVERGQ